MRKLFKKLASLIYRPVLARYLSVTRSYRYKGLHLLIPPEVFHPAFFFSTFILLRHLGRNPLRSKSLLELGAGSGLISMYAAREGAVVTATDINPIAVEYLRKNSQANHLAFTVFSSDLFSAIPQQQFDLIAINPPYFPGTPRRPADYAWYCGENGAYFDGLFEGLGNYVHADSQVFIILSEDCDMGMICGHAANHHWSLHKIQRSCNWMEELWLYQAEPVSPSDRLQ